MSFEADVNRTFGRPGAKRVAVLVSVAVKGDGRLS